MYLIICMTQYGPYSIVPERVDGPSINSITYMIQHGTVNPVTRVQVLSGRGHFHYD